MPIASYLRGTRFDNETRRVMGVAFEMVRVALGLVDQGYIANEIIAKHIIKLAETGERDPDILCELALKEFAATDPRSRNPRCPSKSSGRRAANCQRRERHPALKSHRQAA
jgi:hypothetical protein